MLNLIKYEFLKKYKLMLVAIIVSIVLNLALFTKGVGGSTLFLVFFPFIMAILYIGDILKMYSDDLNKKSGYMLFMTPNSGYKIVLSKLITAVIEGFAILLLYFIFIIINGAYIVSQSGAYFEFGDVINAVNQILSGNLGFNLGHIFIFLLTALLFLISFITTAYTAMTIRKSIFSEVKFGGALSFIIFLLLNWALNSVASEIYNILTPFYDSFTNVSRITATELVYVLLPINIMSIVQSTLLTICSGFLLEKKINL